jgi:hypothetical protein
MLDKSNLLGRVDPSYYANPLLLVNATAGSTTAPASLSMVNGQLLITPNAGFTGMLFVEITATDGALTTRKTVVVTVK